MSRMLNMTRALSIGLVVLAMGIAGCNKVVTQENFDRVQTGQSEADVEHILGTPTTTQTEHGAMANIVTRTWKDGNKSITVHFLGDKVLDTDKSGF